jgi:polysaccharide transporter, PST family
MILIKKILDLNILKNVIPLYGVQIVNTVFPLITVPYLTNVLGAESWGTFAFFQAISVYVLLVVEFGFDFSGTREVARHQAVKKKYSEIFWNVLVAKLFLILISLIILYCIHGFIPLFSKHPFFLWSCYLFGIGQGLNLIWFFQGLEKMKLVASLDVTTKIFMLIGIFVFIKSPEDAWKILALYFFSSFISNFFAYVIAFKDVEFCKPTLDSFKNIFIIGWGMFVFKSSTTLYAVSNTIILGLLCPMEFVGYYAISDRIIKVLRGIIHPLNRAFFPRLSILVKEDLNKALLGVRLSLLLTCGISIILAVGVYFFAPIIVNSLLGGSFSEAITVLKIMAILLPVVSLSSGLGLNWMVPLGQDWAFNKIIMFAGLLNICLAFLLIPKYFHVGATISLVIVELFITAYVFLYLYVKKINPILQKKISLKS